MRNVLRALFLSRCHQYLQLINYVYKRLKTKDYSHSKQKKKKKKAAKDQRARCQEEGVKLEDYIHKVLEMNKSEVKMNSGASTQNKGKHLFRKPEDAT